jgi:PAS domain S-box-containing protein
VLRQGIIVGLSNHTLLIARDGSEYALDDSGAPIRTEHGQMIGVVLVFRDVTARVQAEAERERLLQEAQAARQNLADVLNRITDAFCAFDRNWRVTYINPQASTLTRKTPEELLGNTVWNVFPDAIDGKSYQQYHQAMIDQVPIAYENYYAPYNQWTETRVYPSKDGMTVFSRDVTTEKQAQAAATRNAERKNYLQTITTLLSQALTPQEVATIILTEGLAAIGADAGAVVLLTADGTAVEVLQAIGYPPEMVQQAQQTPLSTRSPQSDTIRNKVPSFIESRAVALQYWPDLANVHEHIDLHAWANLPLLVGERVIGAIGFGFRRSRTFNEEERSFKMTLARQCAQALDRAQLYITEQQARAEAEAAVCIRDQFLSIAAHELRTPLTSLLGNAQLLQRRTERDGNLTEREQRLIKVIVDQARRLDKMILALLDISRLEMGQLAIKRERIDLGLLLRGLVAEIRPTLDQHSLELICSDAPLLIDGDLLRLEQVFQNLIQNALKYSDPLAPVTIRVTAQATEFCIRVEDQGIGIDQSEIPHLFQRFYRGTSAATQQPAGLGIGLFVVQEIVTLHGGTVAVESTPGLGSTFTVFLPRPQNEP